MFTKIVLIFSLIGFAWSSPLLGMEGRRIVGGTDAVPGQFPYQVSLRTTANSHFCGGSIINTRWILSAAHCTQIRTPAEIIAVVGAHLLSHGGVTHALARIIQHPGWNSNTIANDVSVSQTISPITFNANVQPIAIGSEHIGGGITSVVSGWGRTIDSGTAPPSNILQYLNTNTLTNDDCRSRFSAGTAALIFDHKICTLTRIGEGTCSMDSGGPLTKAGSVIGIVSWGLRCASGTPDVFDRVSYFREWILNSIAS